MNRTVVAALYKFAPLTGLEKLQAELQEVCDKNNVCGTLLIARFWASSAADVTHVLFFDVTWARAIGAVCILMCFIFNIRGMRPAVWFSYVTGAMMVIPCLALAIVRALLLRPPAAGRRRRRRRQVAHGPTLRCRSGLGSAVACDDVISTTRARSNHSALR